jgi:hypothetical protein
MIQRIGALGIVFVLVVSSLLYIEVASAQSITKPSVPEFTVGKDDKGQIVVYQKSTIH